MAFFYVHYVLIYQTVTSLTYVFVPLDFKPLVGGEERGAKFRSIHHTTAKRWHIKVCNYTYLYVLNNV